mgnify:CR=1 FL=1
MADPAENLPSEGDFDPLAASADELDLDDPALAEGDDEAFEVGAEFRRDHPHRLRLLSTVLGWGDLDDDEPVRQFVRNHPFVAVRPKATSAAD